MRFETLADVADFQEKNIYRIALSTTDELLKLVNQVEPQASLKYNKYYIGLEINGSTRNFVTFIPRKAHVLMNFKIPPPPEDMNASVAEAGIATLTYDSQYGYYRVRLDSLTSEKQRAVLLGLIQQARDGFRL